MLYYTGHPLIDVGAAAMAAFVGKVDPAQLTEEDYAKVADFIERQYTVQPLQSFLTVAQMNSGFTNPAYAKAIETRQFYARLLAQSVAADAPTTEETCVFTGNPASGVIFSVGEPTPPGRTFREHIPMVTGRGVINFLPGGDAGLPVSGLALLAIQFFPMGCAKCGGKLLAVHSNNPRLVWHFAKQFWSDNQRAITQAQQAGSTKMPESPHAARTLLIKTLLDAEERRRDEQLAEAPSSVTAYHSSNSGQSNPLDSRNPPLQIYHLPMEITTFLATVLTGEYRQPWNAIVSRAWQRPPQKKSKSADQPAEFVPRYNRLYEDLFRLSENLSRYTPRFVRTYFLRQPQRNAFDDDPTRGYSLRSEYDLVSWPLVELFLRKVIAMDEQRIEDIRTLGDKLARYVQEMDDKRFFRNFFVEQRAGNFRSRLLQANTAFIRAGYPPLVELGSYVRVFHGDEEMLRSDWRLARDLVFIRMVEQLYRSGWIGNNPDLVDEATQARAEAEADTEQP